MSRVALAPHDVTSASDVGESAGQPSSGREKLINETGHKGTSHKRSFINAIVPLNIKHFIELFHKDY